MLTRQQVFLGYSGVQAISELVIFEDFNIIDLIEMAGAQQIAWLSRVWLYPRLLYRG